MLATSYTQKIMRIRDMQETDKNIIRLLNELKCELRWDKSITLQQRKSITKRINYSINILRGLSNERM